MRRILVVVVAVVLLGLLGATLPVNAAPAGVPAGVPAPSSSPAADAAQGVTCPTFDAPIDGVPAVANPFDPAQIDVQVTFVAPSGATSTMPAFFMRDYTRALVNNSERLTAAGDGHWRVRFTPTEAGEWSYSVAVSVGGAAPTVSPQTTFTCELDASSHGFLRRSPHDGRYLSWEDGTPSTAIGENLSWYDQRGTFAYDVWLDKLAEHDANWIRVWMPSWAFGLETLTRNSAGVIVQNSLGDYTTRLDKAWQLDYVLEAARARGIVVQLVIQNHGPFTTEANTQWDINPYNAANGGPLATPMEVFTNETAKELFVRRMRYLVARWGHATNLVWEFWNEVDLTNASAPDVIAWHAEMGQVLRALDPYDHLQTTSLSIGLIGNPAAWVPLFALPEIDLSQLHVYGIGRDVAFDFTVLVPLFAGPLLNLGKPMLLAEAGVDFRGPAETMAADPTGQGFHEFLWMGLFSGGYGSGMTWWWDNVIDPQDQYGTLDGLNAVTVGVALDREQFVRAGATARRANGVALQAFPLRGATSTLVWVRNPDNWWLQPNFTSIEGATLTLDGLSSGDWKVEWVDPFSAEVVDGGAIVAGSQPVEVELPAFSREIAVRLTKVDLPTSLVECHNVAGTGSLNPDLTNAAQVAALSLKSTVVGGCTGTLLDSTGPLTALRGKLVGSASCAEGVTDPLRPVAGKIELVWTTLDAKGKPLKSATFVRVDHDPTAPDALHVARGIVTKGPGVGADVTGGFLQQPTKKKVSNVSTIDAAGNVVPGPASATLLADCVTGTAPIESVVFGTDGTTLGGVPFDDGFSFSLP